MNALHAPVTILYSLADLFADKPRGSPGHDQDHHAKCEYILIRAGEGKRDRADGLQSGKQETADDCAVDVSQSADDRRTEADHAEQQAHGEIDFAVIKPL